MKSRKSCIALFVMLCLCAVCVRADNELWHENYYRANDFTKELSDAEQEDLDQECLAFMQKYHLDIALLAIADEHYAGRSASELAQEEFDACRFGYGETRDGFLWIYNTDTETMEVFCFGAAENVIPQDYLDFAASSAPKLAEKSGIYGVLYGGIRYLSLYLDEHADDAQAADGTGTVAERTENTSGLPSWYPADTEEFTPFHNETAARVVDDADILTDAEEQTLEARVAAIRQELQRDIVIYTDRTDYGLGRHICAADFYTFNGYGCGNEYEGVCLFICMDPDNRGWWCCCTGSETRALYTEEIANLIDDELYTHMKAGTYADGIANWVENFYRLYVKGSPYAPDWYTDKEAALTPFHNPSSPRVVDEIGLLTEAEAAALSEQATAVSQKYGVDVAIHTMKSPLGLDYSDVAQQYYTYMGYGFGPDYDGILLTVFKRDGYHATSRITASGSAVRKLSDTNYDRLTDFFKDNSYYDDYYGASSQWLEQVDHMMRTGRVPRSMAYWCMISLLSALFGLIFGGIALARARHKMAPPTEKSDADAYLSADDSHIQDAGSHLLYTTTNRVYDPVERESGGSSGRSGGSSGRSTYSHSYHDSSGRSHSGSGRSF